MDKYLCGQRYDISEWRGIRVAGRMCKKNENLDLKIRRSMCEWTVTRLAWTKYSLCGHVCAWQSKALVTKWTGTSL